MMKLRKAFPGRVIFDHLPKTGGQAVNIWLRENLGTGCVSPNLDGYHRDLIRQHGGLHSVISGHMHFTPGEGLDPRYQYVTLLRDPVDRVASWLYFLIGNHDQTEIPQLIGQARRFIASEGEDVAEGFAGHISNYYVEHFSRIDGSGLESAEERLSRAVNSIRTYEVTGVYTQMDRFVADLASVVGLVPPEHLPRVNVTRQRPAVDQLSPRLRDRIIEMNQLDLRLFSEVLDWNTFLESDRAFPAAPIVLPNWTKYEPIRERIIATPDAIIGKVSLREGSEIRHGQMMTVDVDFYLPRPMQNLEFGIHFFDADGRRAFASNSSVLGHFYPYLGEGSYRLSHHVLAALPAGRYSAGVAFTECLASGKRDLAWCDSYCDFHVSLLTSNPIAGYLDLPVGMSLAGTNLANSGCVVSDASGTLALIEPLQQVSCDAWLNLPVAILNQSQQLWAGDLFRPINMSYHWMDHKGVTLVEEGQRSPIGAEGIKPGQEYRGTMKVRVPPKPGQYSLLLTLVQENVAWFETLGFKALRVDVEAGAERAQKLRAMLA